jgi:hypothetical protein
MVSLVFQKRPAPRASRPTTVRVLLLPARLLVSVLSLDLLRRLVLLFYPTRSSRRLVRVTRRPLLLSMAKSPSRTALLLACPPRPLPRSPLMLLWPLQISPPTTRLLL